MPKYINYAGNPKMNWYNYKLQVLLGLAANTTREATKENIYKIIAKMGSDNHAKY